VISAIKSQRNEVASKSAALILLLEIFVCSFFCFCFVLFCFCFFVFFFVCLFGFFYAVVFFCLFVINTLWNVYLSNSVSHLKEAGKNKHDNNQPHPNPLFFMEVLLNISLQQ